MALREFTDRVATQMRDTTPATVAISEAARRHAGLGSVSPRELGEMIAIVRHATGVEKRQEFQAGDRAVYAENGSRFQVEVLANEGNEEREAYHLKVVAVQEVGYLTGGPQVGNDFRCSWRKNDGSALPGENRWELSAE